MDEFEILNKYYKEACKDITEEMLMDSGSSWYDHIMKLPLPQRMTYTVLIFNWQVLNGGLHQYFANGYGQFCYETAAYLTEINAHTPAEVLSRAIFEINYDNKSRQQFRQEIHTRKNERLNEFDEELCNELVKLGAIYDEYWKSDEDLLLVLLMKYLKQL